MLGRMKVVSEAVYSQNLQPTKCSLVQAKCTGKVISQCHRLGRKVISNSDATRAVNGFTPELLS